MASHMTAQSRRGSPSDTKRKLLEAAERLFALHGIEAVSLRHITQAAEQRNESALHYHFGSREALIEAIFEWRMAAIDAERNAMLDDLEASGRQDDLRALIAAIVHPLSRPIRSEAGPNYYNRFLAEAQRSPNVAISQFVGGKYDRGVQRAFAAIGRRLGDLPERLVRQRFATMLAGAIYGVADIETLMARRQDEGRSFDVERAIENLIDMAAAAMAAPVSPQTQARLDDETTAKAEDTP